MSKSSDELHWRETYFILFPHARRPKLDEVAKVLGLANPRLQLRNLAADDDGLFESLLVESPDDHAAVEISYEVGDSVIEQNLEWAKQLQAILPPDQLQELIQSDARLDLAHFERVPATGNDSLPEESSPSGKFSESLDDEENFDMLDPTCLLTVVDALAGITGGLTFDPASGQLLT